MVLNKYRYLLPRFVDGPANFCIKHHISPNMLTIAGFLVNVIAAVLLAFPYTFLYNYYEITPLLWYYFFGFPAILFFFASYLDALDGTVARKTGQSTKFGGFLDSTLDRISDAVIVLGLMFGNMIWPWNELINNLIAFISLGTILLISYTRSRAELEGVIMKGIGFMERAERIFIILFAYIIEWIIFAIQEFFFDQFSFRWFFPIFYLVFTALCIQTLIARISWAEKWLNNKMPETVAKLLEEEKKAKAIPK